MRTLKRVYEFWAARQGLGKTTALRSRVRDLARHASVTSVWVLDRLNEWRADDRLGVSSVSVYRSESDYHDSDEIPRVVIWQLGRDTSRYGRVLAEAVRLGDVALILDEAYEYAPGGAKWTGSKVLRDIVLAGRHLEREDGEMRPTHLVVAAQYPKSVNHLMWSQAAVVMCGVLSGENSFAWLRENFNRTGFDAEAAVQRLKPFQWVAVHGDKPNMPGYGKDG